MKIPQKIRMWTWFEHRCSINIAPNLLKTPLEFNNVKLLKDHKWIAYIISCKCTAWAKAQSEGDTGYKSYKNKTQGNVKQEESSMMASSSFSEVTKHSCSPRMHAAFINGYKKFLAYMYMFFATFGLG